MTPWMKHFLSAAATAVLAVSMAAPAFAATASGRLYTFRSETNTNVYMNVYRSSQNVSAKGRRLTLYRTSSPGVDQTFAFESASCEYYSGTILVFASNSALVVNRSSSDGSAILWTKTDGLCDSIMSNLYFDFSGLGEPGTGFMLVRTSEFIAYPTGNTGDNLYFKHYMDLEQNLSSWKSAWRVYSA